MHFLIITDSWTDDHSFHSSFCYGGLLTDSVNTVETPTPTSNQLPLLSPNELLPVSQDYQGIGDIRGALGLIKEVITVSAYLCE